MARKTLRTRFVERRKTLRTRFVERRRPTRWAAAVRIAAAGSPLLLVGVLSVASPAYAAEAPVGLGTAGTYSVLGGQTVTNTGPSILSGDLGVSPGSAITGFPPGKVGGSTHAGDAVAKQAQLDLVVAYNDAAGRAPTASVAGDLGGRTLTAGVYKSTGPLGLTGPLTLDAQGDPNAVFIFQVASTLITASASTVNVINSAQACRIFWQVGTSVTLGTNSSFKGTVMALTSTSNNTNAVIEGRLLVRTGQVSLENNAFTTPGCVTTPAPTASFTASATSGTAPLSVQLTNTSTGAPTSWSWNFGNGITSTLQNPSVTYTLAGTYTVSLTASNASGASTPVSRTITVTAPAPAPAPTTTAPAPTAPAPTTTTTAAVGSTGAGRSGSGTPQLARTGASPPFTLAVVLLVLGVLLVATARARTRSRRLPGRSSVRR